jgi:alginate O-acetyltransferase complex protein AlgI
MLFNSVSYIFVFLPVTVCIFWALMWLGRKSLALSALSLASLFFYGWWNPIYVPLLLFLVLANYAIGYYLVSARAWRKTVLTGGLILNLATLGYFKYASFLAVNANAAFGTTMDVGTIVLPLAISFFTFQKIAFICDAYAGKVNDLSFLRFGLFVSFFPQLIAGPIVHHREIMPQFARLEARHLNWDVVATGLSLFSVGLFKKVVIADGLSQFVAPVFDAATAGAVLNTGDAWLGMLAYTFQLYFDFSGYSDMALGSALLFGIRLPVNFYSPYKATSIIDFWRRWHITLSHFLRDYLYIPLGGNRYGTVRRYANLFITMLLGGLWHGAGWTFIFWGMLHGIYLVINHLIRAVFGKRQTLVWRATGAVVTFLAVSVAWVLFRATSPAAALAILHALPGPAEMPQHLPTAVTGTVLVVSSQPEVAAAVLLACAAALAFLAPNAAQYFLEDRQKFNFKPNLAAFLLIAACWSCVVVSLGGPSEFLYFQF